jgi:anti-sigma regulatory factor (Ser/Thr protein kinase)
MRSFRAHPSALHEIRTFVRDQGTSERFPSDALDDLVLAVSEACANAILHTNSSAVEVECRFSPYVAEIEIRDAGVFQRRMAMPEFTNAGRGIPLMMALMDEVSIREGTPNRPGTQVRLVKYGETAEAAQG